ncbi:hypothetical protein WJX72_007843 [[Myrmecia] bisecta]|uniref:Uncharacterized protein n=1 Tax=[Myrmecia] bisecta TaxID=41462 RepID=A0AAW1PSR3_9CHLO
MTLAANRPPAPADRLQIHSCYTEKEGCLSKEVCGPKGQGRSNPKRSDTMGLPASHNKLMGPLFGLVGLAWVFELFGLGYLQSSCEIDLTPVPGEEHPWNRGFHFALAQLPGGHTCEKIFRYMWWTVWFELLLLGFILVCLLTWQRFGYAALARFRLAVLTLLATSLALHMWGVNVTLNLADIAPSKWESTTEKMRARVACAGFAIMTMMHLLLVIVLGDDGKQAPLGSNLEWDEPLVQGGDGDA